MIKGQYSIVITFFVILWLARVGLLAGRELQLAGEDHKEIAFSDQEVRLAKVESRISALLEELSALKKSLRCIQCEAPSNLHDQQLPLTASPKPNELIISERSSAGRSRRLWARQTSSNNRQANFLRGEPGEPGKNGLDGVPGLDGAPGLDGMPGVDGRNGKDGRDGRDGKDGKDGVDGQPGERGPPGSPGPPGPPGEMGKRGRTGPAGQQGIPGPPGVCVYKARHDCSLLSSQANQTDALLMAPVMVGQQEDRDDRANPSPSPSASLANEYRQISVNEGEHIQLSCEAFGQPRPDYVWRRLDTKRSSTILLDAAANLRVSSFRGSQLPLLNVDRLQSGSYECVASNGVPPEASKRINLSVNYAPTVRLSPGPSVYQMEIGSSLLIECIVDANPSPLSYWMFGSDLIMSIPQVPQSGPPNSEPITNHHGHGARSNRYIITESAGQLANGAYYTILTLNITNIGHQELGLYKCMGKNLIGQSVGYALVESSAIARQEAFHHYDHHHLHHPKHSNELAELNKFRELIFERSCSWSGVDHPIEDGWPSYLLERNSLTGSDQIGTNYSIFGNERRQQARMASNSMASKNLVVGPVSDLRRITCIADHGLGDTNIANSSYEAKKRLPSVSNLGTTSKEVVSQQSSGPNDSKVMNSTIDHDELQDDDRCRVEFSSFPDASTKSSKNTNKSSLWLLDQVGKPVYVGSAHEKAINWWALDAKLQPQQQSQQQQQQQNSVAGSQFYATISNITDRLFEYDSLDDLMKGPNEPNVGGSRAYELKHPIYGQSHLVYDGRFIYTTLVDAGNSNNQAGNKRSLSSLTIVMLNLRTNEYTYFSWNSDSNLRKLFERQPLELAPDAYKLSRIEICSDENGIWLIIPTLTTIWRKAPAHLEGADEYSSPASDSSVFDLKRRLHVIKIGSVGSEAATNGANTNDNALASVDVEYHISMKLDWTMIGQLFIIDGVLYGIKDRHLYSSKLQFAYELYKCRLLSSEYLNEPHRTFTNHFGNTQMINYHPNEPKRLFTIDGGNLLWCPVKLIKMNSNDTSQ